MADLEQSLQTEGQAPSGRLRVSAPLSFDILHQGPAIAEYLPRTHEYLKQHRCLHYAYASTGNEWHFEKDGVNHLVRVNAALAGHGVIPQPEFLVGENVRSGRLATLPQNYTHGPISMYTAYPHRRFLSPKVRSFVEHLEARFGSPALAPQPLESYP